MTVQHLFVAGPQRSGTTALADVLNEDRRIIIGRERFKYVVKDVEPALFDEGSFFHPTPEQTNHVDPAFYDAMRERWRTGEVRVLGDKVPRYLVRLKQLAGSFPTAKFLVIYRDLLEVARSFEHRAVDTADPWPAKNDHRAAIRVWTKGVDRLRSYTRRHGIDSLYIVEHARFFGGGDRELELLYGFLGLEVSEEVASAHARAVSRWAARPPAAELSADLCRYIAGMRDADAEQWCLDTARQIRTQIAAAVPESRQV